MFRKKIDNFLEKYNIPRLNHQAMEYMKRPTTREKTESVIKDLSTNKSQDKMASWVKSTKHLK